MSDISGLFGSDLFGPVDQDSFSESKSPPRPPLARRKIGFKTCPKCRTEKPSCEFYKNSKGRLRERCRECCKTDSATYKQKNPKRVSQTYKNWKESNRASTLVNQARYRAKSRSMPFELTREDIQKRIDKNVCELTGLPFDLKTARAWNSPSLDQKTPGAGYTKENTRVVLYAANVMMNTWGENVIVKVAKAISEMRLTRSNELSRALGERLKQRLKGRGSTLFSYSWKEVVTPAGRVFPLLRASPRRTGDIESTSWPTPQAGIPATETYNEAGNTDYSRRVVELAAWPSPTTGNGEGGQSMANASATGKTEDGRKITVSLPGVAKLSSWPTTTRDWKDGSEQPNVERNALLGREVWLAGWPTVRATDGSKNGRSEQGVLNELERKGSLDELPSLASLTISGPARMTHIGALLTGSSAGTASGGQLSPAHSRWLMGYPVQWDDCAPTPTRERKFTMPRPARDLETKCCERCGAAMTRQRFGDRLEDASVFLRQQFCSLSCANTRGNWGLSATARRRAAHKTVKPHCEICGRSRGTMHVHHRDEDFTNNDPTNLQTLCPSCHKKEHLSLKLSASVRDSRDSLSPETYEIVSEDSAPTAMRSSRSKRPSSSKRSLKPAKTCDLFG